MAGVKGRSGGPRKNSGGKRPGAGRKPQATPRTRGSTWMKTRDRILARDGFLCRCPACKASDSPRSADEVDHVIPLSEGGADADENLQAINHECHKSKSAAERSEKAADSYVAPAPADSPLEFLLGVMNDVDQDPRLRVRAAIAAMQRTTPKAVEGGKKQQKQAAAEQVGEKFKRSTPPRLAAVNGKQV